MNLTIHKKIFCSLLITISLLLSSCQGDDTPQKKVVKQVKSMLIPSKQNTVTRNFPGKVLANKEAVLSFQVPGQLIELHIKEGVDVKKEQLLARLDPKKYQDRVDEEKAKFIRAKSEYNRAQQLVKDYHISRTEYDQKKSLYLVRKASVSTAERNLKDTYLIAPFAGVISTKYVENFEHVKEKQPIYKLQDISNVDIEINLPEDVLINFKKSSSKNPPVAVFEAIKNKTFPVTFKEMSTEADPETRTYRVKLTMPAPKGFNILPGMTVTIRAKLPDFKSGSQSFYSIPASAVFVDDDNQTCVWVIEPQTMQVKKRVVKTTRLTGDNIHITSGIQPGETIVTAGVHFLHEGEIVKKLQKLPKE